ncbi:SanA/YdcF family protein [Galbibacter mesophilus]|uniref:SanA/YdcF family protein n=1 Tax=Galbibacter mesophilus TaxID=379069 RepID=UPI00191ED995|nr:ElyC/SanA/YdcF family protein [Galbibacter mesophilus]MCM5662850.1 YdcF family protein [Galbibacter mesophilus]
MRNKKSNIGSLIKLTFIVGILLLTFIVFSNYSIERAVRGKTFYAVDIIPHNKVGLLLGTAKKLQDGRINPYFQYRVDAATKLFNAGKIDFILISGDNSEIGYNEPNDFKKALVANGIPENKIFLDYAGFRTLDSVVRSKKVFGQFSITIISQRFHNERAIYLASKFNIKAVGFNAKDVEGSGGLKTQLREYLARAKVFFDLIFQVEPKYLGDEIKIE